MNFITLTCAIYSNKVIINRRYILAITPKRNGSIVSILTASNYSKEIGVEETTSDIAAMLLPKQENDE